MPICTRYTLADLTPKYPHFSNYELVPPGGLLRALSFIHQFSRSSSKAAFWNTTPVYLINKGVISIS